MPMLRTTRLVWKPLIACLLPLVLAACPPQPPIRLKQITLQPSMIGGMYYSSFSQTWECSVPLPGQGFFLNGLGPANLGPNQIYSGYEDIFNQGAQPFPCNQQQQTEYRGHVQFDLGMFSSVVAATLNFRMQGSENTTGGQPEIPPNSYATVMGMSTGLINGTNGPYFWPYDNDASMPACGSLVGCSADISIQVRQWIAGQHVNWGLIFAGPILNPPGNLPSDNNAQLTWYGGFSLTITYNPSLNPNAPQ
jgi:hypothetical protein